jgi:hypothetical protein
MLQACRIKDKLFLSRRHQRNIRPPLQIRDRALRQQLAVIVAVVNIGIVRVIVRQRLVNVEMCVGLGALPLEVVVMLVVCVMHVPMFVCESPVRM